MAKSLTCTRCGVADDTVLRRETGVPAHERSTHCIAALRDIVTGRRPAYEVTAAGRQVLAEAAHACPESVPAYAELPIHPHRLFIEQDQAATLLPVVIVPRALWIGPAVELRARVHFLEAQLERLHAQERARA